MPRAGFEPATPATKRQQTYTLDRAATGIGLFEVYRLVICVHLSSVPRFYMSHSSLPHHRHAPTVWWLPLDALYQLACSSYAWPVSNWKMFEFESVGKQHLFANWNLFCRYLQSFWALVNMISTLCVTLQCTWNLLRSPDIYVEFTTVVTLNEGLHKTINDWVGGSVPGTWKKLIVKSTMFQQRDIRVIQGD
jgi:hypothetical protein